MDDLATCDRRQFLSGVLAGSFISVAGCSAISGSDGVQDSDGDGVIDSEDYAPQDPDVQEKSDVGSRESTSVEPTPTETAISTPTEKTEREAYSAYESGKRDGDRGGEAADSAVVSYDREMYERTERRYRDALETYEKAIDHFDTAAELANSAGHIEAEEMALHASHITSRFSVRFAETGIDLAKAAQRGDFDQADVLIDDMDSIITAYNNAKDIAAREEFHRALGL